VVASKQMLIETGFVDPERIGIIGGSYGGFMVLAALAFQPDVFDVGVNIFGVSNWLRTLQSIPPWWEAQREALYAEMGDPATDEERLRRISPLFHAHNIRRPLIVLQGANDPRVLQVESDEIVEAVRASNGVPVEYIVFPDEGHGFVNRENEIRGYRAIADFLEPTRLRVRPLPRVSTSRSPSRWPGPGRRRGGRGQPSPEYSEHRSPNGNRRSCARVLSSHIGNHAHYREGNAA
jgi:prolyl oligopeptidase PreP (S9A serine peptidase family)